MRGWNHGVTDATLGSRYATRLQVSATKRTGPCRGNPQLFLVTPSGYPMVPPGGRVGLLVGLALVVVSGILAGPVSATPGLGTDDATEPGERTDASTEENSSFTIDLTVREGPVAGSGRFACTGDPLQHDCNKSGGLATGPVDVDYEGDNHGNFMGRTGGGGDSFTVTAAGQRFVIFFDCEFGPDAPDQESCEGDVLTPAGDVPV